MSSNNLHITRSNYEEYFLLYIDNELSAAERSAVEAFTMLHPDLGEELDLLQGTKLDAGAFVFDDKESLLADHMQATVVDESLLLYVDNELAPNEKKVVELELAANPSYKAQHEALFQTKLNPADTIVYPYKEELYHKEEDRKRLFLWMRVAAAVILMAGVGGYFAVQNNTPSGNGAVTAMEQPVKKVTATPSTSATVTPNQTVTTAVITAETAAVEPVQVAEKNTVAKERAKGAVRIITPQQDITEKGLAHINPPSPLDRIPDEVLDARNRAVAVNDAVTPSQNTNTGVVTTTEPVTYTNQKAADAQPEFAGGPQTKDDRNQGSVRGLLRKATRFIERHTGIKATDDDDRVLAGPLAISLK